MSFPIDYLEVNRQINAALARAAGIDRACFFKEVDLTTAHINLEVNVGDFQWVQFFCDGQPFGITVGIGAQDNIVSLEKFSTIPVVSGTNVYVTNDVRSGRSKLLLAFSRTAPLETYLGGQISLAEVAARLGSIDTFDRRGEVIFLDDFESGLGKWEFSALSTGTYALSALCATSGALSCKLVTAAALNDTVEAIHYAPYRSLTKLSFELAIAIGSNTKGKHDFRIAVNDGTNNIVGGICYDASTRKYQYLNSAGGFTDLATSKDFNQSTAPSYIFSRVKVVVDPSNNKYVRAIINHDTYDMSQLALYAAASALVPYIYIQYKETATDGTAITSWIDDAILKQNEP